MGDWWNDPGADARCPTSGEWLRVMRQLRPRARDRGVRVDVDRAGGVAWFVLPADLDRLGSAGIGAMADRLVELRREAETRGLAVRYRRG